MRAPTLSRAARRLAIVGGAVGVFGSIPPARAAEPTVPSVSSREVATDPEPTPELRALGLGAALIPGVLVHGAGSYVVGKPDMARQLLLLELGGLGLLVAGGLPIVLTGAARDFVGPAAALTILGVGLFAISWAADIYSVVAPEGGFGSPLTRAPLFESSLGVMYVENPNFGFGPFVTTGLTARTGPVRFSAALAGSPSDGNELLTAEFAVRPLGPTPNRAVRDGSALDLRTRLSEHRHPRENFAIHTLEYAARGRLDLVRYDAGLAGSFAELELGYAMSVLDFQGPAEDHATNLLLARFGFGFYVGNPNAEGGSYQVYYDHRHDGLAAGLLVPGLGSGVAGHFGIEGRHFLSETLGVEVSAQVGSAYVFGLSGLFRYGGLGG